MGEALPLLMQGFGIALRPENLVFALIGAFLGTVVGVLPGIGPAGALALMLPIVLNMNPVSALIMLACLYSGAMYGGSTTSILLNVPGESSSVVTCLDGYEMAKQGRAGPALCIAAIGSYIAGTLGVVGLMLFAPMIANAALDFGPPEYFALMVFGLSAVASLSGKSLVKGFLAMCIGLMLATVGTDVTGVARFAFGSQDLLGGVEFLALSIGLFAISEVLLNTRELRSGAHRSVIGHRLFITLKEIVESLGAILRGTVIGFLVGVLPGAGAGIASFLSYSVEIQVSRNPERFGKGEIRGVAAPESANNAASAGALVPMLTLGVPGSGTTAILLAALAALNTPMYLLLPVIMVISVIGVYNANQSTVDLALLCGFGVLGYYMRRNGYPVAPVILGFVLGNRMEEALRQSMIMTQGNAVTLLERPIVVAFLALAVVSMAAPIILQRVRFRGKAVALEEEQA
ncbi:MAG: tripartite tricarboxylate transporter permease [Betaproteobacteria bacterium]|nr:tripartite tricarboxylate transporter permease [Betaproteobacteria bacterium]